MKKYIFIGGMAVLLLQSACNKMTIEDVDFNVTPDKTVVTAGEPVLFQFDGNPNFITFFSGEDGHKYINRNRIELDPSEIEQSTLSFTVDSKYGTQTNALKVYLSKDFPGLTQKDTVADRSLIQTHAWNDITEQCKIADGKVTKTGNLDLKEYQSGFVLAFQYKGNTQTTPQRTIIITDLLVSNKLKSGSLVETKGDGMNFSCFDINPSNKENNCYKKVVSGSLIQGTWSLIELVKLNKIQIQGGNNTHATWADNDDWLISEKIKLNSCTPDTGEAIKDINRTITSYSYTFNTPGTYTVSFLAGNANVDGSKVVLKEMTIEVK